MLVCFDGEAFAARGVAKRHTLAAGAFGGPVVHRVVDGTVRRVARPERRPALPARTETDPPRVDVVAAHHGADGTLVRAAVAAGARGVVLAAVGIGNASPDVVAAVGESRRAPV